MTTLFLLKEDSPFKTVQLPKETLVLKQTLSSGTGENLIQLSTSEAGKLQIGSTFATLQQVTTACNAIKMTNFNPISPKPDWYDGLNEKFIEIQNLSDYWLNNMSVAITSLIPSSVITFTPAFDAYSSEIIKITNQTPGQLGEDEKRMISDILTRLIDKTGKIKNSVEIFLSPDKTTGKLITWKNDFTNAMKDLNNGTYRISDAATDLKAQITKYNASLDKLRNEIRTYEILISTGAGLVGTGAFVVIVGGCIALKFPVAGAIVAIIGAVAIIAGGTIWGVYEKKIKKAADEFASVQKSLNQANNTLFAINTLSKSCSVIDENALLAIENVGNFSNSWATFGDSIRALYDNLQDDTYISTGRDLALEFSIANKYWLDIKEYSQKLLDTPQEEKTMNLAA